MVHQFYVHLIGSFCLWLGCIKKSVAGGLREVILPLCPGEATLRTLCPILGSSVQKRQGSLRRNPALCHKDCKGPGASSM